MTVTVKRINLLIIIHTTSKAFDIRRDCEFPSMWKRGQAIQSSCPDHTDIHCSLVRQNGSRIYKIHRDTQ